MKSIASKKAGPGGPSSYISHNLTQLYMHCNFGLSHFWFGRSFAELKVVVTRMGRDE